MAADHTVEAHQQESKGYCPLIILHMLKKLQAYFAKILHLYPFANEG